MEGLMTSKKHYIAIAREVREILADMDGNNAAIHAIGLLASRLACIFKDDNPAFDRQRFLTACGVA
jgi:hypothetical protein